MTEPSIMLETDEEQQPKKQPPIKRKVNRAKKRDMTVGITFAFLLLFTVAIAYFFVDFIKKINDPVLYTQFSSIDTPIEAGEDFTVNITQIEKLEALTHYELDTENYEYFVIKYSIKNISEETKSWQAFPYLGVYEFSESFDKNGAFLGYYLADGIKEEEYDFNALRYYSLENGMAFFNITNDIASGEEREDADIVKIPKAKFSYDKYFILIDTASSLVKIPEILPDEQTVVQ